MIYPGRFSARIEGDFVLFIIGARVNRFWKLPTQIRVGRAMTRMQNELRAKPELGCLHIENWAGRATISVQYWKSFEHLEAYARNQDAEHLPAWRDFNKTIKDNGDVGIYHETYKIQAGQFEAVYGNMPRFGLAAAGEHIKIGKESTAATRAGEREHDNAPVESY